jgi:uncharacterized protein
VEFLSSPAAYPGLVGPVDVEETHMSWVFLHRRARLQAQEAGALSLPRFHHARGPGSQLPREVRLNLRRLAPEVYLGVVALNVGADGALALGGDGEIVDWLVRMRRLPAERMLDRAIASGTMSAAKAFERRGSSAVRIL